MKRFILRKRTSRSTSLRQKGIRPELLKLISFAHTGTRLNFQRTHGPFFRPRILSRRQEMNSRPGVLLMLARQHQKIPNSEKTRIMDPNGCAGPCCNIAWIATLCSPHTSRQVSGPPEACPRIPFNSPSQDLMKRRRNLWTLVRPGHGRKNAPSARASSTRPLDSCNRWTSP